ncbi:MAG: YciE/YciF ferroxidase family protein [Aureliella sp.]
MAALKNLSDAFYDELRDMLSAEKQLLKALPKMMKKASSEELKQAFETHLAQTEKQVERLEQAFEDIGKAAKAKKCEAMAGLIEEASSMMEEDAEPEVMDAVLIACAQKVEHYEIASYGTLCSWAKQLGLENVKEVLGETLNEEEETDKLLTQLSRGINRQAKAGAR